MSFDLRSIILIVDDSETSRLLVRDLLLELGYKNVVQAADGKAGIDEIKS